MSEETNGLSFQQRMVLTVVLCLGIYLIFDLLFPPPPTPETQADAQAAAGETDGAVDSASPSGPEQPSESPEPSPVVGTAPSIQAGQVEHRLENELLAVDVGNAGAGLIRGIELRGEQFREADGKGLDFLLLGDEPTLELSFDPQDTSFSHSAAEPAEVLEQTERRFSVRRRSGEVEITQTLELGDTYELLYDVELVNRGGNEVRHRMRVRNRLGQATESSRYDLHRALCLTAEDFEEYELDDLDEGSEGLQIGVSAIAVTSQYFVHALVPSEGEWGCEAAASSDGRYLLLSLLGSSGRLGPGETRRTRFGMYLGAKNQHRLRNFDLVAGAGLERTIDWGWFGGLSRVLGGLLFDLLRWIHSVVGIWGVAIIILTAMIKVATLPLTLKQMSSMKRMREIQPEIEKVKQKYGTDRVKQSQEMQALFQRTGVNPLAGCLPMLVQMPIWFALYSMLSAVVELYHEPFLWLPDLTKPDPFFVLPLGMGALMFVQTRIQPTAVDNQQAKMMQWMMPVIFTVMMLFLPSGLGVYIFANIVLSLVQTFIQLRPDKKSATATAK